MEQELHFKYEWTRASFIGVTQDGKNMDGDKSAIRQQVSPSFEEAAGWHIA